MVKDSFQIRSMTAFGRGEISFDHGRITVEIATVNRRHLEINLSLPRHLSHFEMDLRKKVAGFAARGQVNVTVSWFYEGKKPVKLVPNLTFAQELKAGAALLKEQSGIEVKLDAFADQLFFEQPLDEGVDFAVIAAAVDEAGQALVAMKRREGQELGRDIATHLKLIEGKLEEIETRVPTATEKYRKKLSDRMDELGYEVDERVLKEIALYAERVDISEELVRAKSHLGQFLLQMGSGEVSQGKMLDFLCQELLRELNTIGSKSSQLEVSQLVMGGKADLEKVREQVQNVE